MKIKTIKQWVADNPKVTMTYLNRVCSIRHPDDPPMKFIMVGSYMARLQREKCITFERTPENFGNSQVRYLYNTKEIFDFAINHGCAFGKSRDDQIKEEREAAAKAELDIEKAITNAKHILGGSLHLNQIKDQRFLSEGEIVRMASCFESPVGIYFLIDGFKVVYVGQSVNVAGRIAQHLSEQQSKWGGKDFTRYAWIPCPKEALDLIETIYILMFRPKYNNGDRDAHRMLPINYADLLKGNVQKSRNAY